MDKLGKQEKIKYYLVTEDNMFVLKENTGQIIKVSNIGNATSRNTEHSIEYLLQECLVNGIKCRIVKYGVTFTPIEDNSPKIVFPSAKVIVKNREDGIQPSMFVISNNRVHMITATPDQKFKVTDEGLVGERYNFEGNWCGKNEVWEG